MTPWILGFPLVVLAMVVAALVWENHRAQIQAALDKAAEQVRETLESIGRLPLIILLALTLVASSQPASAAVTINVQELVQQILVSAFEDVGGSPPSAGVETPEHGRGKVGQEAAVQTHPTPVAVEQEVDLPLPPAPAAKSGKASWYGERFAGRKTASGERFNPQAMTTAHKSLPFGTDLEVCRKGQCVEVRVTDRGPFTPGRSLDLSRAAFAELAPTSRGVINVQWRVL